MAESKVYVKVVFHMKIAARDLETAMMKAREALLDQKVTFDPDNKESGFTIAYDGEISDDSGYITEPVFQ